MAGSARPTRHRSLPSREGATNEKATGQGRTVGGDFCRLRVFDRGGRRAAQSDAAAAYSEGKKAFEAGKFDKARELFTKASQTDNKNPEVFLWLGKADYQLGAVDDAIAAWGKTQALSPDEPYSAQMLKALRGNSADADTTLSLVEALVADEQYDPAGATANKLLADKGLTDASA